LTGMPIDSVSMPPDLSQFMPASLAEAEGMARQNNPRVQEAIADLNTAREDVSAARADLGPRLNLEGRARAGHDIDGFEGKTTDLQGAFVLRWDVFNGGIKEANVREQLSRADEVHARLFERTRAAEEATRSAWSRLQNQGRLVNELETQGRISDDLLLSYREQFNIGRRSLLDVLDAQNTRYNVQAQTETARLARLYAQYRLLAASNRLIEALGVQMATSAYSDERTRFKVNPIPPEDRQENSMLYPRLGPPVQPEPLPAAAAAYGPPAPPPAPVEPVVQEPVADPAAVPPVGQ
jgi:outer membrane protein, adhesin transport system